MQGAFGVPSALLVMFNFSAADSGLRLHFMPLIMFKAGRKKMTGRVHY
jgi:hypothetical protein